MKTLGVYKHTPEKQYFSNQARETFVYGCQFCLSVITASLNPLVFATSANLPRLTLVLGTSFDGRFGCMEHD